jgi:hypothetical protein
MIAKRLSSLVSAFAIYTIGQARRSLVESDGAEQMAAGVFEGEKDAFPRPAARLVSWRS